MNLSKYKFIVLFFLSLCLETGPLLANEGFPSEDMAKYIKEGRRQLGEIMAYNRENEECNLDRPNIYIFSFVEGDDWIGTLSYAGGEPKVPSYITALNDQLEYFNDNVSLNSGNPAVTMYACVVSHLPLRSGYYDIGGLEWATVEERFSAFPNEQISTLSQKSLEFFYKDYEKVATAILQGTGEAQHVQPPGIYNNVFKVSSNKILLSHITLAHYGVKLENGKISEGQLVRNYELISHHIEGPYFTEEVQQELQNYFLVSTQIPEMRFRGLLEKWQEYFISIDDTDFHGSGDIDITGADLLTQYSGQSLVTDPSSLPTAADEDLRIFDYTGLVTEEEKVQLLQELTEAPLGTGVSNPNFIIYLTDNYTHSHYTDNPEGSPFTFLDALVDSDLDPNTILVHVDIDVINQKLNTKLYSSSLESLIGAPKTNRLVQVFKEGIEYATEGPAATAFGRLQLYFSLQALKFACSTLSTVFSEETSFPAFLYNPEADGYDEKYAKYIMFFLKVTSPPVLLLDALVTEVTDVLDDDLFDQVLFAFLAGSWNQIMQELASLAGIGELLADVILDPHVRSQIWDELKKINFSQVVSGLLPDLGGVPTTADQIIPAAIVLGQNMVKLTVWIIELAELVTGVVALVKVAKTIAKITSNALARSLLEARDIFPSIKPKLNNNSFPYVLCALSSGLTFNLTPGDLHSTPFATPEAIYAQQVYEEMSSRSCGCGTSWNFSNLMSSLLFLPPPTCLKELLEIRENGDWIAKLDNTVDEFPADAEVVPVPEGSTIKVIDAHGNPVSDEVQVLRKDDKHYLVKRSFLDLVDDLENAFGISQPLSTRLAALPNASKLKEADIVAKINDLEGVKTDFLDDLTKVAADFPNSGLTDADMIGRNLDQLTAGKVDAWDGLYNLDTRYNYRWLNRVEDWRMTGITIERTLNGAKFKNSNQQEIAVLLSGDKLIPSSWNESSYFANVTVLDQLDRTKYRIDSEGGDITGDLELINDPVDGHPVFRRKYTPGCGTIVNFDNPNLQGLLSLKDFDPNLGFSGVFDLNNNKFILHPSADFFGSPVPEQIFYKGGSHRIEYDPTNTSTFAVNRTGGHITGNNRFNEILGTSGDHNRAGFAVIFESQNSLRINFKSIGLNPKFHPANTPDEIAKFLPENLQAQIIPFVQSKFPGFQISID